MPARAVRPADRDLVADLARVVAVLVVALGHWLVVVILEREGAFHVSRLLEHEAWTRGATWLVQVMPLFFLVGGHVNRQSLLRADARGEPWHEWVQRRATRLLLPLLPLVGAWSGVALVALALGAANKPLRLASHGALLPIWFLGVYLAIVAAAPLTARLHARFGVRALVAMLVGVAMVDALAALVAPWLRLANVALAWAAIHQMGYHLDGALRTRAVLRGAALVAGGLALALALVVVADYPVSMVAVGGGVPSNASPPTLALVGLGAAQLGVLLTLHAPLQARLARPAAMRALAALGSVTFTIYLWHVTALALLALVVYPTGVWPATSSVDAAWWWQRPVWVAACATMLAPFVLILRRFEHAPGSGQRAGRTRVVVGVAVSILGVTWVLRQGLIGAWTGAAGVVCLGVGAWLLCLWPRGSRHATA